MKWLNQLRVKSLTWFMGTDFYESFILKTAPFIRFSTQHSKIRGHKYWEGYNKLRPGLMVGTVDYSKMTGILIPKVTGGILSHVALCVDKRDPDFALDKFDSFRSIHKLPPIPSSQGKGQEIVEMTHLHFTFSDFFDLCKESDRVVLFECVEWDADYTEKVIAEALKMHTAKYDARFQFGLRHLYCSELIYQADLLAGRGKPRIQADIGDLMGIGQQYISPDGLLTANNIRVVWDSANRLQGMWGHQIEKVIFKEKK